MAQAASTMGGAIAGSVIGNGISTMLFGSRSHGEPQQAAEPQQMQQQAPMGQSCDADQRAFMKCVDSNANDVSACQFYMQQWKECQSQAQASSQWN